MKSVVVECTSQSPHSSRNSGGLQRAAWTADEFDAGFFKNPLQFDKRLGAARRDIIGALQSVNSFLR